MATILSEILDQKRQLVGRLRADPASRDFRDRALAIRANAKPHRLLRALVGTPRCGVRSTQRADPISHRFGQNSTVHFLWRFNVENVQNCWRQIDIATREIIRFAALKIRAGSN